MRWRGGGYRIVGAFFRFPSCIDLRGQGHNTWRRDLWRLVQTDQICSHNFKAGGKGGNSGFRKLPGEKYKEIE